jgi:hypothetical protein
MKAALGPWAASRRYLNLADVQGNPARFWNDDAYDRPRRINNTAVDPDDRMRSNHPVPATPLTTGAVT